MKSKTKPRDVGLEEIIRAIGDDVDLLRLVVDLVEALASRRVPAGAAA